MKVFSILAEAYHRSATVYIVRYRKDNYTVIVDGWDYSIGRAKFEVFGGLKLKAVAKSVFYKDLEVYARIVKYLSKEISVCKKS